MERPASFETAGFSQAFGSSARAEYILPQSNKATKNKTERTATNLPKQTAMQERTTLHRSSIVSGAPCPYYARAGTLRGVHRLHTTWRGSKVLSSVGVLEVSTYVLPVGLLALKSEAFRCVLFGLHSAWRTQLRTATPEAPSRVCRWVVLLLLIFAERSRFAGLCSGGPDRVAGGLCRTHPQFGLEASHGRWDASVAL